MAIIIGLLVAALTSASMAQSLLDVTALDPQLSDFSDLLLTNPDAAAGLLTNISSGRQKQTILVPSNGAFDRYRLRAGSSFSSLSSSDLGNVLNYHTLQGSPAFFVPVSRTSRVLRHVSAPSAPKTYFGLCLQNGCCRGLFVHKKKC